MANLARKFKRKREKKLAKEIGVKMSLFNKLPSECEKCSATFDKTDKEMVQRWHVITYDKTTEVHLFCPPCWQTAVEELQESIALQMEQLEESFKELNLEESNKND